MENDLNLINQMTYSEEEFPLKRTINNKHDRPLTAPPSTQQLIKILEKSNSGKKNNEIFNEVKNALNDLNVFVIDDKGVSENSQELQSSNINIGIDFNKFQMILK